MTQREDEREDNISILTEFFLVVEEINNTEITHKKICTVKTFYIGN